MALFGNVVLDVLFYGEDVSFVCNVFVGFGCDGLFLFVVGLEFGVVGNVILECLFCFV